MASKRRFSIPDGGTIMLSVLIIPLLTALIAERTNNWPKHEDPGKFVIDVNYLASTQPGTSDFAQGTAPANMELGIYLNDDLLAITQTNAAGVFRQPLPVLPQRVNTLTALPVNIDQSTLLLFYELYGFQQDRRGIGRPLLGEPQPPFLTYGGVAGERIQIYGSTEPKSKIELCNTACDGNNALVTATSDNEGSFSSEFQIAPVPFYLYSRIQFEGTDQWITFDQPTFIATDQPPIKRTIQLTASPTEMQVTFVVDISERYKVFQNLVGGGISPLQFVQYLFGKINLNTYLDPRRVAWRAEKQGGGRVRVFVESEPLTFLIPQDSETIFQVDAWNFNPSLPPYGAQDQITVDLQGTHLIKVDTAPVASTQDTLSWNGLFYDTPTPQLTIWISRNNDSHFDQLTYQRLRNALADILKKLPKVNPSPILRESLEGSIVGLLPANDPLSAGAQVPLSSQAQVYDFYRGLYLADPLVQTNTHQTNNLQDFVLGLPGLVAGQYENLLFGALWFIPTLLLFLNIGKIQNTSAESFSQLRSIGWLAVALVAITLDWTPLFSGWISRRAYLTSLLSANLMLIWLAVTSNFRGRRGIIFILFTAFASVVLTVGLGLVLFDMPDAFISILIASTQLLGWLGIAWLATQVGAEKGRWPSITIIVLATLLVIGLSIPIQFLPIETHFSNNSAVLTLSVERLRPLLPLAVLLAAIYMLLRNFDGLTSDALQAEARDLGRVILIAFAIGLTPAWGFIPVSILLGALFFEWLLQVDSPADSQKDRTFLKKFRKKAIDDLLRLNKAARVRRAIEASWQKQLRDGKLIPEEYDKKLKASEDQIIKLTRPAYLKGIDPHLSVRDLPFNYGAKSTRRENAAQAVIGGILLLLPLLLIAVIPLALGKLDDFLPYPFLDILIRLGIFMLEFLASAFFLGFFFPYLRGRNGLEKAGWLSGTIILCLLPVHLLLLRSLVDISALIIWVGGILVYNLLIGLLAFDLPTLTAYGFQWDRFTDLYDLRDLTFSLTGSGAPLITALITALGGNLNDLVPALLRVVFPNLVLQGPRAELLKMLLDMINRVSGNLFE